MMKYIFLCIAILAAPMTTHAYFGDTETSNSTMSAGRIAFMLSATTTELTTSATTFTFEIADQSTQSPQYSFATSTTCANTTFIVSDSQFSGEHGVGIQGTPQNNCEFTLITKAWQQNFTYNQGGFTASSTLTFIFHDSNAPRPTATVVLNEIYPNRNIASSSPLNKEWIELYNGTNMPVDVGDWQISVDNDVHGIVAGCTSAARKMAPLNGSSTIIAAKGLLVVEFCTNISQAKLPNGGAVLKLSPGGAGANVVDAHTYPSTAVGKSHARIPDGANWVDPVPTPGTVNMVTVDELIAEGWDESMIDGARAAGAVIEESAIDGNDDIMANLTRVETALPDGKLEEGSNVVTEEVKNKEEDMPVIDEVGDVPVVEVVEEKPAAGEELDPEPEPEPVPKPELEPAPVEELSNLETL